MYCKKSGLKIPNTPPPTLWKSSIHAGSAHITCRKTVRMCSTWRLIHFRFLAHSLANVRSLGCGERTIQSLLWQRLQLVKSAAVFASHQPAVSPLPSGTGVTKLATALPPAF